jgi:hypothetical protein
MTTSRSLSGGRRKRGNGHKVNCGCPICKNMRKSKKRGGADGADGDDDGIIANDIANDIADVEVADDVEAADELWDIDGGRRRRRGRKSARKSRRTRRHKKSRKSRRHRR